MSIKGVFEKAKGALGEKAPEILVGLGIVSIGAGVFFACKATLKIKDKKALCAFCSRAEAQASGFLFSRCNG